MKRYGIITNENKIVWTTLSKNEIKNNTWKINENEKLISMREYRKINRKRKFQTQTNIVTNSINIYSPNRHINKLWAISIKHSICSLQSKNRFHLIARKLLSE